MSPTTRTQYGFLFVLVALTWSCGDASDARSEGDTALLISDMGVTVVPDGSNQTISNDQDAATGQNGDSPDLTRPEYCQTCHSTHYSQWRSSMHAYATQDPIFLALNRKGIAETKGKLNQFCVQCHAPNASQKKMLPVIETNGKFEMPIDLTNPLIANGVQCISCHNMKAVEATQNAKIVYSETMHYGPNPTPEAQEAHAIESSKLFSDPFQKNVMCGSCHDFVNPNGVRLDSTFSSWYSNEFNEPRNPEKHRTCQDCHMPSYEGPIVDGGPSKTAHSHYFVGVYQALLPGFPGREKMAELAEQLLSDCAKLEVRYNGIDETGHAAIVVSVENINNGHNLPAGSTADTQVWVHLEVYDSAGDLLLESGMTDDNGDLMDGIVGHSLNPEGDPELMLFGQLIFGQEGEHVNFPWQAHAFTDNLIGPGQRKWRDFSVPISPQTGDEIRVIATLKYRTFPPFLLRVLIGEGHLDPNAIEPIPIIDMETVETTFQL